VAHAGTHYSELYNNIIGAHGRVQRAGDPNCSLRTGSPGPVGRASHHATATGILLDPTETDHPPRRRPGRGRAGCMHACIITPCVSARRAWLAVAHGVHATRPRPPRRRPTRRRARSAVVLATVDWPPAWDTVYFTFHRGTLFFLPLACVRACGRGR
jgi:hypothetical protein